MTGHDLTQAMLGLVIALLLYHLKSHGAIDRDLADLKPKVRDLWRDFIHTHERQ